MLLTPAVDVCVDAARGEQGSEAIPEVHAEEQFHGGDECRFALPRQMGVGVGIFAVNDGHAHGDACRAQCGDIVFRWWPLDVARQDGILIRTSGEGYGAAQAIDKPLPEVFLKGDVNKDVFHEVKRKCVCLRACCKDIFFFAVVGGLG